MSLTNLDIINFFVSFVGSLGFALLYNLKGVKLVVAGFGGVVAWGCLVFLKFIVPGEILTYFFAAGIVLIFDEIFARVLKTPTTSYLVPSIVPLTPGAYLYYSMSNALSGDIAGFITNFSKTIMISLSIAGGIIVSASLVKIINSLVLKIIERKKNAGKN